MHQVEQIIPKDDGFHGAKKLSAEWWYFDGVFKEGYSFHIGIRTFTRKKRGRTILFFELYKNKRIIFEKKKKYSFKEITTTDKYPSVKIKDDSILSFDLKKYKEKDEWLYHIFLTIDECTADLIFKSITQGFKIETKKESWTVAIPKGVVSGTITYNEKKLSVDGIGYHDHNWNYTILSALTYGKGWYWGKIKSKTVTIVWANVMKRSGYQDLVAVVCPDHDRFYNINAKLINFNVEKQTRYHRRKIPSVIHLSFQQIIDDIPIDVDIRMEVKDVHFSKVAFASYWRYHVNINGLISVDNKTEKIDTMQIMEYLRMI